MTNPSTTTRVTLPPVPGIAITAGRDETAPRQPTIRRHVRRCGVYGAAAREVIKRRIEWIREAVREAE